MENLVQESFLSKFYQERHDPILREFFTYEYYFLSSNQSLNPSKFKEDSRIYITSMDNYFTFPMVFNRAIFKAIDEANNESIQLYEYVNGLLDIYTGTISERIMFIFKMFCSAEKDLECIQKSNVSLILNYTHIFFNKQRQDLLKSIIDDFFGQHSFITLKKFVNILEKKTQIFSI